MKTSETVNVLSVEKTRFGNHHLDHMRPTRQATVDDPDQVHDQDSQLLSGDGRRLRMKDETQPATTTDQSNKRRSKNKTQSDDCTNPSATSIAMGNHLSSKPSPAPSSRDISLRDIFPSHDFDEQHRNHSQVRRRRIRCAKVEKNRKVSCLISGSKAKRCIIEFVAAVCIHTPVVWTLWHDECTHDSALPAHQVPQKRITRS